MSDLQKNIIENFLKEKKKTKRDLAKFLGMQENSINRSLKNSNISILKLKKIAEFLEIEMEELIEKKTIHETTDEYTLLKQANITNRLTINNLSEALNRSSKTIDNLIKIIAENYPDKSKNLVE